MIRAEGGLAATWQLTQAGFGRHAIRAALERGEIIRVRHGWYAEAGRRREFERAARVGGRLTCGSALDVHGFWVVGDAALHVAVRRDRTQLRSSRDHHRRLSADRSRVRVHWGDSGADGAFIVDPLEALRHYAQCATPEFFAASAESVMHDSPHLASRVQALGPSVPITHRRALAMVDGICESGTETLFRWRMRTLPLPMRRQVSMPNVGAVDFVLGDRLVVEIDGKQYHETPGRFEKDRERDANLSAQGFRVLRFSYFQVIWAWPTVERAVLAAAARGDAW